MDHDEGDATNVPGCPRCGYDMSGMVASWTAACPLEVVCSECGLGFRWGEYLALVRSGPVWSYEHGIGRSARRLAMTLALAMWPGALWRRLRLEHEIRRWRLAEVVGCSLLLMHGLNVGTVLINHWLEGGSPWGPKPSVLKVIAWPYDEAIGWGGWGDSGIIGGSVAIVVCLVLFMTASALVLGDTFKAAKIRRAHLLRAGAYTAVPAGVGAAALPVVLMAALVQPWPSEEFRQGVMVGIVLLAPALIGACWMSFVGAYLRLRAAVIVPVLMVIAVMATVCFLLVLMLATDGS